MHHQHTRKSEKKNYQNPSEAIRKEYQILWSCRHHQLTHVTPKITEKTERIQNYDQREIQIIIKIKPFPKIRNWTFQILQYPSKPRNQSSLFQRKPKKKVTQESERTKPNGKKNNQFNFWGDYSKSKKHKSTILDYSLPQRSHFFLYLL